MTNTKLFSAIEATANAAKYGAETIAFQESIKTAHGLLAELLASTMPTVAPIVVIEAQPVAMPLASTKVKVKREKTSKVFNGVVTIGLVKKIIDPKHPAPCAKMAWVKDAMATISDGDNWLSFPVPSVTDGVYDLSPALRALTANAALPTLGGALCPIVPDMESNFFAMPENFAWEKNQSIGFDLADFEYALHATSVEQTRFYLCGIYCAPNSCIYATDGHRLVFKSASVVVKGDASQDEINAAKKDLENKEYGYRHNGKPYDSVQSAHARLRELEPRGFIVPSKACKALIALGCDFVRVNDGSARIEAYTSGCKFTAKLIDGTYPDAERVIPKDKMQPVSIDFSACKSFLKNKSRVAVNSLGTVVDVWDSESVNVYHVVNPIDPITGKARDCIGFNGAYVAQMLAGNDSASCEFSSESWNTSPVVFNACCVLMPMRL